MRTAQQIADNLTPEISTTFQEAITGYLGTTDSTQLIMYSANKVRVRLYSPDSPEWDLALIDPMMLAYYRDYIRRNMKVKLTLTERGDWRIVEFDIYSQIANFSGLAPTPTIQLPALSIGTEQLQNGAVTTQKLADGAVTDVKFSGQLSVGKGGTGADLSATGGVTYFVRQASTGAPFTVGAIVSADLTAALTTPPPIGGTTPNVGTFNPLTIKAAAGTNRDLEWRSGSSLRWLMRVESTAEGSNAGSNFELRAYADDGSSNIFTPLLITRSTGAITLADASGRVGFFGVTPVVRQGATTDLKDLLTSYGLVQGTSASPLNLDSGALTAGTGTFVTSNLTVAIDNAVVSGAIAATNVSAGAGSSPILAFRRALAGPAQVTAVTVLGSIQFYGYTNGSVYSVSSEIRSNATESYTSTARGSEIEFFTRLTGSTTTKTVTMENTGKFTFVTSSADDAQIRLPGGVVPTSPIAGDIWHNSSQVALFNKLSSNQVVSFVVCPFTQAEEVAVTNTTTDTKLATASGAIFGTDTLVANHMKSAKTFVVELWGRYTSHSSTTDATLAFKVGGNTVCSVTVTLPVSQTDQGWYARVILGTNTVGSSGTAWAQGKFMYDENGSVAKTKFMVSVTTDTVNSTLARELAAYWKWTTANASNSAKCTNIAMYQLN